MSVFATALAELQGRLDSEAESFIDYWERTGLPGKPRTAEHISVQSIDQLDDRLVEKGLFPFRLGRAKHGQGTAFALAASRNINDFFLQDSDLFTAPPTSFQPDISPRQIYQFVLFTKQMEVNAVNLAVASGLLTHALDLDRDTTRIAPATIASTFSFSVRPTSRQVFHEHVSGQVEIDAAFIAHRRGESVLVILEAKHGLGRPAQQSLSKTKLTYPIAAVLQSNRVPAEIPIIPVYLRSYTDDDALVFRIAECVWPGLETLRTHTTTTPAVTAFTAQEPGQTLRLELPTKWPY